MHRHHIIPKHMGGTDDEENLTPPISIAMHSEFHKDLYEHFGDKYDLIAWKALSGRLTSEQARLEAAKEGQKRSKAYNERDLSGHLNKVRTKESCSNGGKAASVSLVQWIKDNKDEHKARCQEQGRKNAHKKMIPHEYQGVVYKSKKSLQEATKLSNTGFYAKLRRGEVKRLIQTVRDTS